MKKSLFLAVCLMVLGAASVAAQPRAIGVNLGTGCGFSYQHGFGEKNMLDVAANIPMLYKGFGVGGHVTYDWIDPFGADVPWSEKGEWHWYMGVGGAGGAYGLFDKDASNYWYAGVAGHVGIEYDFWFPFQLSLDWRPSFGYSNGAAHYFDIGGLYGNIALGVRYKF